MISLVRKVLPNRGSSLTHRLLFALTNHYSCTIVSSQLERFNRSVWSPHIWLLLSRSVIRQLWARYRTELRDKPFYRTELRDIQLFNSNLSYRTELRDIQSFKSEIPLPHRAASANSNQKFSKWKKTNLSPACQLWPRWPLRITIYG